MTQTAHYTFISSIPFNSLHPFYTTLANNEVIYIKDSNGTQFQANSLTIFTNSSALYIQIGSSDFCIYIPANDFISLDYLSIESFKVLANSGAELRWYAMTK
jgi:hypothetical protein